MKLTAKTVCMVAAFMSAAFSSLAVAQLDEELAGKSWSYVNTERDSWYIGFGIQPIGAIAVDGDESVKVLERRDRQFGFDFQVGGTVNPNLLVGGELGGFSQTKSYTGVDLSLSTTYFGPVVTYFPMVRGPFVKAGLYLSTATAKLTSQSNDDDKISSSVSGQGVGAGFGYAFWLGKSFNLTAEAMYRHHALGRKSELPVSAADVWTIGMGFYWY